MNLNHLIIIGNGFDLNLGLKTDYSSFIDEHYVFENLETFKESAVYPLFSHLKNIKNNQNWVDIELELQSISNRSLAKPFNRVVYEELINCLVFYLKVIDYKKVKKDSNAYQFLDYLSSLEQDKFNIINFNYTNVLKDLIKDFGNNFSRNTEVNHIHGNINNLSSIVFGVHDQAQILTHHSFLYKSNPNVTSPKTNLNLLLPQTSSIHIFGHSLGLTDHSKLSPIFDFVFERKRYMTLYLYHYGVDSLDKITNELMVLTGYKLTIFKELVKFHTIDVSKKVYFSESKFYEF